MAYKTYEEARDAHPCFCGAKADEVMQVTNDLGMTWLENLCMAHVVAVTDGREDKVKMSADARCRLDAYKATHATPEPVWTNPTLIVQSLV